MKNVYMDNNATTMPAPEVTEAMLPFFREHWGNPSSMHSFGGKVKQYIDEAREKVAALISADPSEIVFTGCGSESDNMAIRGGLEAMEGTPRVITTRVEHLAALEPCRHMRKFGHHVVELEVDSSGQFNLDELSHSLDNEPTLASIMWANNETGVVFPVRQAAEMVKAAGGVMHTDAVQAGGKLPIDVRSVPVDMLSISGHKLHAPKGIGALYVRKGTKIKPFLLGGHQESGKRAGTENVPYIVGFGHACELAARAMEKEMTAVAKLRDRLQEGILATIADVQVNGDQVNRLPNTLNISFQYVEGEAILYHLNDFGIAASSGSACTSGSLEPSHVIRAMGVPFTMAHGSIRFSLSRYNTEEDVDYVLDKLPGIIEKLRMLSPFAQRES